MPSTPAVRRPSPADVSLHDGDASQTRDRILDATFRRLVAEGYAALSVREIAKDAGVNHALINYHFRSKDQLVIEVLDAVNQRLLSRQASMYQGSEGFAQKWASARRFYQDDLASGFVRLQAELWAASLSNPGLREKFLPRLLAWKQLVLGGVREALVAYEATGAKLPPPFTAEVVACWISEFWLGMEFADLLGVKEESLAHHAALDAVQWLLQSLDEKLAERSSPARRPRRRA
ncbi:MULTISPECIES: TetR/AcrR family transcriptional regulator [unclassified Rhizobacter]|uniref:TetR/AcrR family transcriptional regulator n=1 Tax=unclassified Rhizobacter TaxID=2640088 RepID=UPI0009E9A661|nr:MULTISPECIES: TetR/AcrR family transcriptional regulator [unclassified Rhizobacter]